MIRADAVKVGDRIMWAGYECTVLAVHGPAREKWAHPVHVAFDLSVPGKPNREGVRYSCEELVEVTALVRREGR